MAWSFFWNHISNEGRNQSKVSLGNFLIILYPKKKGLLYMWRQEAWFCNYSIWQNSRKPEFLVPPQICLPFPPLPALSFFEFGLGGPWSLMRKDSCCLVLQNIRTHRFCNTPRFPPTNNSRVDLESDHCVGGDAGHFMCCINKEYCFRQKMSTVYINYPLLWEMVLTPDIKTWSSWLYHSLFGLFFSSQSNTFLL